MNHAAALRPVPAWGAEIAFRVRHLFLLKLVGTSAFIWVFFIGYFHLLRHPSGPVAVMPLTPLDHWFAFQPPMLVAYFSLWVYVGVAPGLQRSFAELLVYALWIAALCLTGLTLFYLWPSAVPVPALPVTDFPGFAVLQGVDAAGNACPSMHVAVAIFSAIWIEQVLRSAHVPLPLRVFNAAWFIAIAYSTLAIKQHVVLDVAAGALLGMAFAWPALRWRPGRRGTGAEIIQRHLTDTPR